MGVIKGDARSLDCSSCAYCANAATHRRKGSASQSEPP